MKRGKDNVRYNPPRVVGLICIVIAIFATSCGAGGSGNLTGADGTAAPSLSPAEITIASQPVGVASAPQSVILSNTGGAALSITSIAFTGANPGDFAQTNNCGPSVAAGASCTINVSFKPTAMGSRAADLTLNNDFSSGRTGAKISGTGLASAPELSPTRLSFTSQSVGAISAAQEITLSNSGNAALSVSSFAVSGANSSDFSQTNNCGSVVEAGAHCTISVTFKPLAAGTRTAEVSFDDNASGSPQTVALSGTIATTSAGVSPSNLTFASQTVGATTAAQEITVTDTGNEDLNITGIAVSGLNATDFIQSNNCGSVLAVGAHCTISVSFRPAAAGTRTATVTISDSASGGSQAVGLSGTGTATPAAEVSLSPTSVSFGSQTVGKASAAQSITLTNIGNAALTISSVTITGSNAGDFAQTNNCGSNLAADAKCTINVTFTPSASGSLTSSLSISDNAGGTPLTVSLAGTGASTGGGVSLSPTSLAFSNEPVDLTSTAQTVTLTNNGTTTLTISSLAVTGANSSDFVQNNNCGSSVAAGVNCTIVVLFTPSAIGARAAAISISDNAAGSPQDVNLSGTGSHDVVLSWTASATPDVIGYNVYRGTKSGGESSTPLNSSPVSGTSYTDENVTAGAEYFYLVTSVTSDGGAQSSASPETSAIIPSP